MASFRFVQKNQEKEFDCGRLLLEEASGRFVYHFWEEPVILRAHDASAAARLKQNPNAYREVMKGASGFDGRRYWRVIGFPPEFGNRQLGSDALLLKSWNDILLHDQAEWEQRGAQRTWRASCPVHNLMIVLGIRELSKKSLRQAIESLKVSEKDAEGIYSAPSAKLYPTAKSLWAYSIFVDESKYGFSRIECSVGGLSGAWPIPCPPFYSIVPSDEVRMSPEDFDDLCDSSTYLSKDAKPTVFSAESLHPARKQGPK